MIQSDGLIKINLLLNNYEFIYIRIKSKKISENQSNQPNQWSKKSTMKNIHYIFCYLIMAFYTLKSQAQVNLVPNGNFEDVEICQSGPTTSYINRHWFTPQDRVIPLDNPCFYGSYWSPQNNTKGFGGSRGGLMETYGFFTQFLNLSHHRVYLVTKLTKPLVANKTYYFEMSFKTLDTASENRVSTDFTDAQSVAFTNDFPIYDWSKPNSPIPLKPVLSHSLVEDFVWHKLKGCFVAHGGEQFLLIGNFKTNNETKRTPTGLRSPTQFTSSNFVVDNVILTSVAPQLRDTVVCENETAAFDVKNALIDSLQYRWHNNSTTPQYKSKKTEHIFVQIVYPTENCIGRADANVTVISKNQRPNVKDTTVCQNEKAVFMAGTGLLGETIAWKNGEKSPKIQVYTEGAYLADIKNRCANWTDTFRLRVQHCGFEVFVPNAFSPNGDGWNDDFKPFFKMDYIKIESYDFRLFNRWGSLVFASQNVAEAWDGNFRGRPCESGVYVWTITVQVLLNGKVTTKQLSGDVTIIR
jgi:gliding motility-associated-like protein